MKRNFVALNKPHYLMLHPLIDKFTPSFLDFRKSTIQNLFLVCNAVLKSRSTNLNVIKDYLPDLLQNQKTREISHYKRLIRFFKINKPDLLMRCILKWVYQLLSDNVKYLILDATLWERGNKQVHLLTLCVVYKHVAIPIYWHQLDKNGGHSSQEDRQKLIIEASEMFNLSDKILLADREFVGDEWLKFLKDRDIDFIIRLSKTCYKKRITQSTGVSHSSLQKKALKRKTGVGKNFDLNGSTYTFVAIKNAKNDPNEPVLFLISSLSDYKEIANTYRIRWRIETCFRQLKSKGFNLEDLNFIDDKKILLMVAIVVMAYVLSIQKGLENVKQKFKKYKNGQKTLAISVFRVGLTKIKALAWNFDQFIRLLYVMFNKVEGPKWLNVQ